MEYHVILILDEKRAKNYYYSYSEEGTGNLKCSELPPYQDINKARSCYWDGSAWVYDEEKYAEIIAAIEAQKKAEQEEADRIANLPSLEDVHSMAIANSEAINEIMTYIDETIEPLTKLAEMLKS